MDLSSLRPACGSVKNRKKIAGRGQGSGRGGTSTRGHKGAKSRSGYSAKLGFEGGQMPLQRRIPKFGFKNINNISYKVVNVGRLQEFSDSGILEDGIVSFDLLVKKGITGKSDKVKVLGFGELNVPLKVEAHGFTSSAKKAIEAAGGKVTILR